MSALAPRRTEPSPRRGRMAWATHLVGVLALLVAGLVALPHTASAAPPVRDGSSEATAAASCWEIKQNVPTKPSGIYWLYTPELGAPQQFYCDQTTDGGGWVLIGRGREGWRMEHAGLGTPDQVRSTVTGPGAFAARQLPASTVDGLLGGQDVDELVDGVRLRRATNQAGTTWQETRFGFLNRDRWVWTFGARHATKEIRFDGVAGGSGLTANFGADNLYRRVNTESTAAQSWTRGFAFGGSVTGSPAAGSYVWSATTSTGWARPFTQMYLRPRLSAVSFPAIPDAGTSAQVQRPLAQSGALPTVFGVAGLATSAGELRTEVQAFTQVGNYVYVGGNFATVQRSASDTAPVAQPFLAAFHVDTGQWLSSFRPVLNNQVKSLAALPNGQVVAGGEFTQVNGQPAPGVVALNATTGASSTTFDVDVENRLTGSVLSVRSLQVSGPWLYLGGQFTHLSSGGGGSVYSRSVARVAVGNGAPDAGWTPAFNGAVNAVDPSPGGDRLYAAGYFTLVDGATANKGAALQTVAGAPLVPWTPRFSNSGAQFQFTVLAEGGRVWLGGSEHSFFSYNAGTLALASGNITLRGGDFQTSTAGPGIVYGGCHCDDFTYSEAYTWSNPGTTWTQADKIGIVGAWDSTTGEYLPEFTPISKTRNGHGAWASFVDSKGVLWLGGSYQSTVRTTGANQWSGGFARFAARDAQAPSRPSGLSLAASGAELTASWSASTDNSGTVRYELLRDDRVVATASGLSVTVPVPQERSRWFVRAVDPSGNRSPSTAVVTFDPAQAPAFDPVVQEGAQWSWRYDGAALPAGWASVGFDDGAWAQGAAPLGFGSTLVDTVIHTGAASTRPLSAQFRKEFQVADAGDWGSATVSVWVDDGAVVFLNGTEIGRRNLPTGTIGQGTYATAAPRTTSASQAPLELVVPGSLLVDGTNVLAVQTHLNYRSTPDVSMESTLTLESPGG